jgi:hypothetical protein
MVAILLFDASRSARIFKRAGSLIDDRERITIYTATSGDRNPILRSIKSKVVSTYNGVYINGRLKIAKVLNDDSFQAGCRFYNA